MPSKAESWLTEEALVLLEGWARDGLSGEKIAGLMGVGASTFYKWQKKYPQIAQAVRKGRETVDYQVEQALLDKALGGDLRAQMYWLNNLPVVYPLPYTIKDNGNNSNNIFDLADNRGETVGGSGAIVLRPGP